MISEHLLTAGGNLFPTSSFYLFIFMRTRENVDGFLQYIKEEKKEINDFLS